MGDSRESTETVPTSEGVESRGDEHFASLQAVPEESEEAGGKEDGQAQDGEDRRESEIDDAVRCTVPM